MTQDEQHLQLLSIFHYVVAGLIALFALFPIIHVVFGVLLIVAPDQMQGGGPPPAFLGWVFVAVGSLIILMGWTIAALVASAGIFLTRRTYYTYCLVVAGLECLMFPFGTVLGILTIIVLIRPSVRRLFGVEEPDAAIVQATETR